MQGIALTLLALILFQLSRGAGYVFRFLVSIDTRGKDIRIDILNGAGFVAFFFYFLLSAFSQMVYSSLLFVSRATGSLMRALFK